ncbi:hypothetical protein Cri9333_2263 [Crinalium epipsammum PCC 9333]|uniref:Lipoprotein n=1 Tax=Crinalium epipsammum PCC 9333 TaxID=1173022 RepID=K9VYD2_9CYAN|nr:hypothetical protein Cri9333_2263 [Crinalium epipsammum PCC 9333]
MIVRLIVTIILLAMLTACGVSGQAPSMQLVEKALIFQLHLTQNQFTQQLHSSHLRFEITQLQITDTKPLIIQNLSAYHIQGTYNLIAKLPHQTVTQQHNLFEVYLQRQKEGKTWRLARPQADIKDSRLVWLTYLIPYYK